MARGRQGLAALFISSWLCLWILTFTAVSAVYGFEVLDVENMRLHPSATSSDTSLIQKVDSNFSPDIPIVRAGPSESDISSAPNEIRLSSRHLSEANATKGIAREQDRKQTGRSLLEDDSGHSSSAVPFLVFHKLPSKKEDNIPSSSSPLFPSTTVDLTYCVAPSYDSLNPKLVTEWLSYHLGLVEGKGHFFWYESNAIRSYVGLQEGLAPFVEAGVMEIENVERGKKYMSSQHRQLLSYTDCLHRSRYFSKWVANFELDEYLLLALPSTLRNYLESHDSRRGITIGRATFAMQACPGRFVKVNETGMVVDDEEWGVERMILREPELYCEQVKDKSVPNKNVTIPDPWFCPAERGGRKWIANPYVSYQPRAHNLDERFGILDVQMPGSVNVTLDEDGHGLFLAHYKSLFRKEKAKYFCRFEILDFHKTVHSTFVNANKNKYRYRYERVWVSDDRVREQARTLRRVGGAAHFLRSMKGNVSGS